jgi:hypothetical protein
MALPPGTGAADIALSEIITKKLTFQLAPGKNGGSAPTKALDLFTNAASDKKAA